MSSLVVTAGTVYTGMDLNTVDDYIEQFNSGSNIDINPEIKELIKPAETRGYSEDDRNIILKSATRVRDNDTIVVKKDCTPCDILYENIKKYKKSDVQIMVNLDEEKEKCRLYEEMLQAQECDIDAEDCDDDDDSPVVGGTIPEHHQDPSYEQDPDVVGDDEFICGGMLFHTGSDIDDDDEIYHGGANDYFEW
jgi:hypothetical protein